MLLHLTLGWAQRFPDEQRFRIHLWTTTDNIGFRLSPNATTEQPEQTRAESTPEGPPRAEPAPPGDDMPVGIEAKAERS